VAKFCKSTVWAVPEKSTLILDVSEFPYNTTHDRWKEASTPKTIPIRSAVSIEHQLVAYTDIDRVTDGHRDIFSTRACRVDKNEL